MKIVADTKAGVADSPDDFSTEDLVAHYARKL